MLPAMPGDEVVDADDLVPLGEEALAEVRADEAGAAGDQGSHEGSSLSACGFAAGHAARRPRHGSCPKRRPS